MSKPIIVCEASATQAAAIAEGYDIQAIPKNGIFNHGDFEGRRVILWPDATPESRSLFKSFAEKITDICTEVKIIVPNGRPHGWNISTAKSEGMTWADLALWAKTSMMAFGKGEFPKLAVETSEEKDPIPASIHAMWEDLGLSMGGGDRPALNADNIVRILTGWEAFRDLVWYDEFYQRYLTRWNSRDTREWSDMDDINLTVLLQREFGLLRISQETVSAGVRCRGYQIKRHEPRDWLASLKWDGKSRIDTFFAEYLGAKKSGYSSAVSRNFWIGMVARLYRPGCQLDNMVILEGRQGIYKSKALEAIGGKWYMEAAEEITSKDFFVALAGKLIVEIADLDSFSRADTNRIKKVITCRTDRYRQPYGRATQDHPRQSIFVGTTNEQHYLRDSTGARRFWPITCGRIELDRIRADREQLFAEAVSRYLTNEDWYKVPHDETVHEQDLRRDYDEWENLVQEYVVGKSEISLTDFTASIGMDKAKIDKTTQMRLGIILRRMGWERRTVRRGLTTPKLWFAPSELPDGGSNLPPSSLQVLSEPLKA